MRKSFTRLFSIFVLLLGLSLQMAYGIVFVPASSVPTDGNLNAKPTDFATKFVVAFDVVPVISDAGGTVVIYKGGGLFKTLPISKTSANAVVVGKTIEITHGIASFLPGEVYNVAITDGAITGLAPGALNSTVYDFTIGDYVAPKLLTTAALFTPNLGAIDVIGTMSGFTPPFNLVIPFDEAVNVPVADNNNAVYIYSADGTVVEIIKVGKVGTTTLTGGGTATITVPVSNTSIFQESTTYYVAVDAGAFVDVSPNKNVFGGLSNKTTWTFTTRDNSAPVVSTLSVTAITTTTATLNVTVAEKGKYYYATYPTATAPTVANVIADAQGLAGGNATKIAASCGTVTVPAASVGVNITSALTGLAPTPTDGGVVYKTWVVTENSVTVGANVVATAGRSVTFTTIDRKPPGWVVKGILNNAAKQTTSLYMVFVEKVVGGTGMLDIRLTSDDSYIKSIPASAITSRLITSAEDVANTYGSGNTIQWVVLLDLGMTLPSKVDYYVVFPADYIKDAAGNSYAGVNFPVPINKGNWAFTSSDFELPTVSVVWATPASLASDITVTFNETVTKQLAATTDWAQVLALELNGVAVPFTVTSPAAAGSGTVIVINPTPATLASNTSYTLRLRANAVKDLSGNAITTENLYTLTTGDLDAFAVQYGSSLGATTTTGLAGNSTFQIKFNKAVKVNTGTIAVPVWADATTANLTPLIAVNKTDAPGAGVKTFTVDYDAVTFTATITPTVALISNAGDYTVTFTGTKVKDSLTPGTILTDVTTTYSVKDYEAPVAATSHNGDVSIVAPLTITLTDDNLATLADLSGTLLTSLTPTQGASLITFKEGSSNGANLAFTLAGYVGGVITITPTAPLTPGSNYYYGIGASVKDASGNVTAGKFSTFKLVVPAVAPTITANTYTVNGSAQTPVATKLVNMVANAGNTMTVTVTFNDNVKEFTGNPVTLTIPGQPGSPFSVAISSLNVSGNTLTVDFPTGALNVAASSAVCTISLPAALVQGSTAITGTTFAQFAGQTILFDAKDIMKPVASANLPGVGATGIAVNTPIKIGFSETVVLGTGNILIKEGVTVVQTIAVGAANVSITGTGAATVATITKTGDLPKYNTTYTIEVPTTAFTDVLSLNPLVAAYSGTFTTVVNPQPTATTYLPANGADLVALNSSISVTFSEEVEKNYTPGTLTLKGVYLIEKNDGAGTLSGPNDAFTANGGTDVLVASLYIDVAAVAISGNTVTLNFGVPLAANKDYYILIAPNSFRDKSAGVGTIGNPVPGLSAGITASGTWNFTTSDVKAPTVIYSYTKRADNKVATTSDITLTFSKPIEKVSGSAINSSDISTLFTLKKTAGPGTLGVKAFIGTINTDKTVVTILNSSLVTLGEFTALSSYTIEINAAAIRGVTNHVVLGANLDPFITSDYTAPVATPSIVAPITDIAYNPLTSQHEATVLFTCTDNVNLATVYYTIQPGDASTAAPTAAVVKADKSAIVTGAAATTTFTFTGLSEKTSYVVWAVAIDDAGNESAVKKVVFVTDDVTKPLIATLPTSFDAAKKLTFIFNEAVTVAGGNLAVRILEKETLAELGKLNLNAVPGAGNEKKLITDAFVPAITNTLVSYYVEIDKGIVADVPVVAGDVANTFNGLFRTDLMVTSSDVTAPNLTSTTPALPAVGVDVNFSIKLTFDEAVQKVDVIPANAFFLEKEITPGSGTYEPYEVIDPANVVTNGTNEVIVTVARQLTSLTKYQLTVNKAAFKDLAGNVHAAGLLVGTITSKDVVAPTVAFLPAKNAPAVLISTTTLTLTFNEAIRLLDNTAIDSYDLDSLVYFQKAGAPAAFKATIDGTAKIITITPTAALVKDAVYTYGFKAKFEDASDNVVPADAATFTTETAVNPLLTWLPAKKSPYAAPWPKLGVTAPVTLTFTGPIFTYNAGVPALSNLPVTPAFLGTTALTVKKNTVAMAAADLLFTVVNDRTISVAPKDGTDWGSGSTIEVTLNAGTIQINEGNVTPVADVSTYQAIDVIAPKVDVTKNVAGSFVNGYYPAKIGTTGVPPTVAITETLRVFFDENVSRDANVKFEIHRWDGVLIKGGPDNLLGTMRVTMSADLRTGTLTSALTLSTAQGGQAFATNEEYYVILPPGIVIDTEGNPYAGLTDPKVWRFILKDNAAPQLVSYTPTTSPNLVTTDLTINFDRPVVVGNGYVALYKSAAGGDAVQIWRGADNGTTNAFSVSGSTATVNISDLEPDTQYFVEVGSGTFASAVNGMGTSAIDRTSWSFKTEVNAKPVIVAGGYLPAKNAIDVVFGTDKPLQMTFDMPVQAGTGSISVHSVDGATKYSFDVNDPAVVTFADNVVSVKVPAISGTNQYYVIVDPTAIRNKTLTPEYFAGVIVPLEWKFNTPVIIAYRFTPNKQTIADNHPIFVAYFTDDILIGTGNLTVYKVGTTTPALTIPITASMVGNKVLTVKYTIIAPAKGLDKNTDYYVHVDAGTVKDDVGNQFVGVNNATDWVFKTGPEFATGIPADNSLEFKVYPNPFVEYVTVENASKLSKVIVTNIAGQVVKEVVNPTSNIQLSELRSGIYFISLYDVDNVIAKTAKIVKR